MSFAVPRRHSGLWFDVTTAWQHVSCPFLTVYLNLLQDFLPLKLSSASPYIIGHGLSVLPLIVWFCHFRSV